MANIKATLLGSPLEDALRVVEACEGAIRGELEALTEATGLKVIGVEVHPELWTAGSTSKGIERWYAGHYGVRLALQRINGPNG